MSFVLKVAITTRQGQLLVHTPDLIDFDTVISHIKKSNSKNKSYLSYHIFIYIYIYIRGSNFEPIK